MQVTSPVLVGRAAELTTLTEALTSTQQGRGGAVFLVGDAGLGKSRLVRECATTAAEAGMTLLRGRATPAGATVPYRPLTEALLSLARADGVPDDPELVPYRPALGRLIPEWREHHGYDDGESPVVLAEAVLRLLRAAGRERGVLVCLGDLHDGDAETMGIVEYLVDNLGDQPVLLLATLRGLPSPALGLARSAAQHRVARLVELGPLGDAEVAELAAACLGVTVAELPAEVGRWLVGIAGGNPFVVEELLRGAVEVGALVRADGHWRMAGDVRVDVPTTVVTSVTDRARRLGPRWHRALSAASVIGRRFPMGVLQQVAGLTDPDLHALLRAGVEAQLLEPSRRVPGWYTFRHAWTADALAGGLLPAERASLAASAAAAIEAVSVELSGELCQLAAALWVDAGDRPRAGMLYTRAGRRALADGAAASAVRLLDQALELLPQATHPAQRAAAAAALLSALAESGEVDVALRRGAQLAGSVLLSPRDRAGLHTRLAWVCVVGGHWDRAAEQVSLARELLGAQADPADIAPADIAPVDMVEAHLLTLADVRGDHRVARAEELAARAVRVAEEVPLPTTACQARQVLALLARRRGFDAADVHLRHMLDTAERHGLSIWQVRAQIRLATNELMRSGVVEPLLAARQAARRLGAVSAGLQADATYAMQLVLEGEFGAAQALADEVLATTTRMHQAGEALYALVVKIAAAAHQGRRDALRQALVQYRNRGGEQSFHAPIVFGHRAIGALLLEDRPGAEAEMARVREWERSFPTIYYQSGRYGLDLLLEVLAGRAGRDRYTEILAAPAAALRWNRQFVAAADAVLRGRAGDFAGTVAAMEQSQQAAAVYPTIRHLLLRLVASAALDDGWGDPVGWLRTAEGYFHTADVSAVAGACRSLLRQAGVRVMQRRTGLAAVPAELSGRGVTAREYEVLLLIAERRGNPEIARLLYISPRTVEKHVTSLLGKLSSSDRNGLCDLIPN